MTAQQPVNQQDFSLVEQFLDAMWMERGLSENTLASYRNDLMKLLTWMEKHRYRLDRCVCFRACSSASIATSICP